MAVPIPFTAQLSAKVPMSCRVIAKFNIAISPYDLELQLVRQT